MRFSSSLFLTLTLVASLLGCGSSVEAGGGSGGSTQTITGGAGGTTTTTTTTGSGGTAPMCDDPPSPAVFEVGTGLTCFERLTAGQTVPVIQGPQGGFHLWLAVGCADCGAQAILSYGIKDITTQTWVEGTGENLAVIPLDPGPWGQVAGLINRLPGVPWSSDGQLPKGTHVLVSVKVLDDADEVIHEGEVEVVLGDIEPWAPPCDENPATCGAPGGLPCCTFGG